MKWTEDKTFHKAKLGVSYMFNFNPAKNSDSDGQQHYDILKKGIKYRNLYNLFKDKQKIVSETFHNTFHCFFQKSLAVL